jgi:hypothetical protein
MTRLHKNNHDSWTNMFNLKLMSNNKFYNFHKGSRFMILYTSVQKVKTLLKLENTNLSQSKTMDHVNTSKTW